MTAASATLKLPECHQHAQAIVHLSPLIDDGLCAYHFTPAMPESGLVDCRVSFDAVVHRSQQTLSDGLLSCTSTLRRDYFWELKYFRVVFGPLCPQLDLSDQAPCSVYPTYTYLEVLLGASSGDGVYMVGFAAKKCHRRETR